MQSVKFVFLSRFSFFVGWRGGGAHTHSIARTRMSNSCPRRVTRGVTVSMSAFLACDPCYCAGSSLAWGLNFRASRCHLLPTHALCLMIIIIIIIALKDTIRDFLQSPHCAANRLQQVRLSGPGAIVCKSCGIF